MNRRGFVGGLAALGLSPRLLAASAGRILAAASLADVLDDVTTAWAATGAPPLVASTDATSRICRQLDAGAPAELIFCADTTWMQWLVERRLVDPATRTDLLGNRLVLVVPASATSAPRGPEDLAAPTWRRLALAGEAVPAGRYARQALASAGLDLATTAIQADHVRTVLAWVARGEVDAGIVYATDAAADPQVRAAFAFPTGSHDPITYPAAVCSRAADPATAAAFLAFCRQGAARAAFLAAGFSVLPAPDPSP